ncbi:MAG TPA: carboxypeptidase-like regulatory domain-containing protein [Puia sp.]
MRIIICVTSFLLLFSFSGKSQQFLTGKVFKKESTEILVSVSIYSISHRLHDLSEENGSYRIQVAPGERVIFSSVGYRADTITVTGDMLSGDYPVYLEPKAQTLQAVTVGSLSNYQLDSMARRNEYSWIYEHGNVGRLERDRKGADGVGVSIDLFKNASSIDKQRERLKKRLLKEEQEYYVDSRYNREYVSRLTHLQGDSLQKFVTSYRPTYDFCRKAATVDILVFISDSFKKFKKGDRPD